MASFRLEGSAPGYFVRRAQVWIFKDANWALAKCDLNVARLSVLALVEANPRLAQVALASALGTERARQSLPGMREFYDGPEWHVLEVRDVWGDDGV